MEWAIISPSLQGKNKCQVDSERKEQTTNKLEYFNKNALSFASLHAKHISSIRKMQMKHGGFMPVIPALGRLGQEDPVWGQPELHSEFKVSLRCLAGHV